MSETRDRAVEQLIRVVEVVGGAAVFHTLREMGQKPPMDVGIRVDRDGPMRLLIEDCVDALIRAAREKDD